MTNGRVWDLTPLPLDPVNVFAITSGPMPAGSPMVIPTRGSSGMLLVFSL